MPASLVFLLLFNLLARVIVLLFTDLGIDEAYYFSYARVRDWSYFDHPPLIGQLIYLTTLGLQFCGVFFVRLGPLLLGTLNLILIYLIGKEIDGRQTGFRAALMASASFYVSVVSGVFIMPDTPLGFFWLISLWFAIKFFLSGHNKWLLFFGLSVGLAMLSKYQAVYLWLGMGLYILLLDRKWLKSKFLYFSIGITAILFLPVILWNLNHHLASLAFHGNRVGLGQIKLHWFAQEMAGQLFYNNPVVVFIGMFASVSFFRKS